MQLLYPEIKPYARHQLNVDETHTLYLEESGSADGIPVLFIHGGPGSGCGKYDRRFFNPQKYRIILFDQRGAGRSQPHAELEDNTTPQLIADIEKIRQFLNIDNWMLFGGSWGSTLALLYAQAFPDNVMGLILRGIFLAREKDLNWLYQAGADRIFPDYWQEFIKPIADEKRSNLVDAYYELLTGENELAKMAAAKAWSSWEARCATLRPSNETLHTFTKPHRALSMARIEAHYFKHACFIEENQILRNMEKIESIPGIIIHGRYDMVCTLDNATELHHAWLNSELHIIRDAGHAATEQGNADALVKAANTMAQRMNGEGDQTS